MQGSDRSCSCNNISPPVLDWQNAVKAIFLLPDFSELVCNKENIS